jgi:hypothetical protein
MPDEPYVDFILADPYIDPVDGGCWYCYGTETDDLVFSWGFDTNVHLSCIRERLTPGNKDDGELRLLAAEFGLVNQT